MTINTGKDRFFTVGFYTVLHLNQDPRVSQDRVLLNKVFVMT